MSVTDYSLKKINSSLAFAINKTVDNANDLIHMIEHQDQSSIDKLNVNKQLIDNLYAQLFNDISWTLARSITLLPYFRKAISSLLISSEIKRINALINKIGWIYKSAYYSRYFKNVLTILKINVVQLESTYSIINKFDSRLAKIVIAKDEEINDKYARSEYLLVKHLVQLVKTDERDLSKVINVLQENDSTKINYNRVIKDYIDVSHALKYAEQMGDCIKQINKHFFYPSS